MNLKLYFITLFIFLGFDALWLGMIAPTFYRSQIGHLMAEKAKLLPAGLFYALFVGVLIYFVVEPSIQGGEPALSIAETMRDIILRGTLFGLVMSALSVRAAMKF